MSVLECRNLGVGYRLKKKRKVLIRDLNLEFEKSELISLLGANGIGKSSFLKTLIGNIAPIGGSVLIQNKQVPAYSKASLAREISFVSSGTYVAFNPSVFDFVALGRIPYIGWTNLLKDEDKKIIHQAIEHVKMSSFTYRKLNTLSDGERQKIAIAKALCQDTPIILMDEPTAFLDIENKFEVIKLLHKLVTANQKTIIFSSHDIDLTIQFSDYVIILNNNSYEFGCPEDLILNQKINRLFTSSTAFFDKGELRFKAKAGNRLNLEINNNSDEFRLKLTQNALSRISFQDYGNYPRTKIILTIEADSWKIERADKVYIVQSFSELVKKLKLILSKTKRSMI